MKSFLKYIQQQARYIIKSQLLQKKSLGCNFVEDTADRKKTVTVFKSQMVHQCQPASFPFPA